ncbi:UvrD-helicase domain-containing protein [Flavobacteriales bacterium]|nr:UvrD-helicase domain-containing protein [Flavobacteriales bacterium]
MSTNFNIYRSSAGSGKTYTLALNFIALSLKGGRYGYHDYYRKILAITFSNKAAAEMKERVLEYLKTLADRKDVDEILSWLINESGLDKATIFKRSKEIHNHILHHYANLGILTIDKFTYRIVRTFATDLGLSHNFELEMDNYKIIQPVVALLLSKVSDSGGELSNALINFTLSKAEEGKSTNIERDLEEFTQHLFKEKADQFIGSKSLSVHECMKVKKDVQKQKDDCKKKIQYLADKVCAYFDAKGLTKDHFISGTFYNHFTKNIVHEQDKKWMPTTTLQNNVATNIWCANGKSDAIKETVEVCKHDLELFFNELIQLIIEFNSCKAILKNIYSIAVLNELMVTVKAFKTEQNIEQISVFNKKIHHIVANQPSSFIYERLGDRYNHYLIDEFQDTSLLQWQNILPLITDSLDYGKSLIVGDGKQSIYRWRGGEVEQFFQLPKIYNGDKLQFKSDWENKLNQHYNLDNLVNNYRSCKEIIEFNNDFFDQLKTLLSSDLAGIYKHHTQKSQPKKDKGYVHLELFGDKENEFKQLILERMRDEIIKLTTINGYLFKDITILCNSRKRVSFVADYLSSSGISVISNEGLLLRNSDKVNLVISCLKYLRNTNNVIAKSTIVTFLQRTTLSDQSLHQLNLMLKTNEGFHSILKSANIYLNEQKLLEESLYEMVEQLVRILNLKEGVYLQFFLDVVLTYTEKKGSNLSSFLQWWEERKEKESVVIPEGTDAVQIMTIHKSKGLAFNVVMIPFNWEDSKKSQEIWVDTSLHFNKLLPSALVSTSKTLEHSYFRDDYFKEKSLSLLDNLNKLYVAMTRSKERLYIFSKYFPDNVSTEFAKKGNLNSFLYQFSDTYPIKVGDPDVVHNIQISTRDTVSIKGENKLDWRDVISLKHSAEEVWDIESQNAKKDWGKLLHKVLADIHHIHQKDEVIENTFITGQCTEADYLKLKNTINELLEDTELIQYFSDKWEVKTEKEILMDTGRTYIPDRLLFDKNTGEVIVIDYKTGKEEDKHIKQISDYVNALKQMGHKNVKQLLIYTNKKNKVKQL